LKNTLDTWNPENLPQSVEIYYLPKLAIRQWDDEKPDGVPDVTVDLTLLGQRIFKKLDKIRWTFSKSNVVIGCCPPHSTLS